MFFTFSIPVFADEQINDYKVFINVKEDASINVREEILYNFGEEQRHGIFRDIPYSYKTNYGNKKKIEISEIDVRDQYGKIYNFTTSKKGREISIKIGDPNVFISGTYLYVISYRVNGAISYFDEFDEIYWNAIGHNWQVPIMNSFVEILIPQNSGNGKIQYSCYLGKYGEQNQEGCQTFEFKNDIKFVNSNRLNSYEGMTVAVGFPKGVVYEPTKSEKIGFFLKDNIFNFIFLIIPFLLFIILFKKWQKEGKDPKGSGVIIPQYDVPDNLNPLEVGALVKNNSSPSGIPAEIIYLATKGFLKITKIEGKGFLGKDDYELTLLKDFSNIENNADKILLEGLFKDKKGFDRNSIKLKDLKTSFYKTVRNASKENMEALLKKGYYLKNPNSVRVKYFLIFGLILLLTIMAISVLSEFIDISIIIILGILGSLVIILIFGIIMPKRTQKGLETYEHILGLKEYLQIAEKDRLEFHNAPEKKPEVFEKLLPYAMVLGVEKAWEKEFEDIYTTPPSWYSDPTMTGFSAIHFGESLSGFATASQNSFASSSSGSGGGGFSGGGAGGGGGGSW